MTSMRLRRGIAAVGLASGLVVGPASPPVSAQVDQTPPTATITAGVSPVGYAVATFSEPVGPIPADSFVWSLIEHDGARTTRATTMACKNGAGASVSCSGSDIVRASLRARTPHPIGAPMIVQVGGGAAPIADAAGNPLAVTEREHAITADAEETDPATGHGWARYRPAAAADGALRLDTTPGATATYRFSGDRVTWVTRVGPNDGRAAVLVDGALVKVVDNSAAATAYGVTRSFYNLGSGAHTLVLQVRGEPGRDRRGTAVVIDGFRVGSRVTEEKATYAWPTYPWRHASAGRLARTITPGAAIEIPFWGGAIDWWQGLGPNEGIAQVLVDGAPYAQHDGASARASVTRRRVTGLRDGAHVLMIRATGRAGARGGRGVSVDRVSVRASVEMFRGLGAWIDLFDFNENTSESTITGMLDTMKEYGVRTLYLETARYNSSSAFDYPTRTAMWLRLAHARGISVVGWYFPAYSEFLEVDVARTIAVSTYRSPDGHRFDAVGIDIEYRSKTDGPDEFNADIVTHLRRVRAALGATEPIASIAPPPNQMELAPSSWRDFPWRALGADSDAVLPMAYSSYRKGSQCPSLPKYCTYRYTKDAVTRTRTAIANPLVVVHVIGGISNLLTDGETEDFVRGARDGSAFGSSLYDHRTTRTSQWEILAGR